MSDDGLWATDPAAEEVSRMLDAICHRCDRAWNECDCAEEAERERFAESPDSLRRQNIAEHLDEVYCMILSHDQRTEDVETGIPMRHARPDDEWEND